MPRILYISVLVMLCTQSIAQSKVKCVTISGRITELNLLDSLERPITGIPIEVWSGNSIIATFKSESKGKYNLKLAYYPIYTIKFGNANYVTKVVEIDASNFKEASGFGMVLMTLDITLFKNKGYMGLDFMSTTPVAKAFFHRRKGAIVWDMEYADKINARISGILEANR
jgi:hypothetical protein